MIECQWYHIGTKKLVEELITLDKKLTDEKADPEYVLKGIEDRLSDYAKRYYIEY